MVGWLDFFFWNGPFSRGELFVSGNVEVKFLHSIDNSDYHVFKVLNLLCFFCTNMEDIFNQQQPFVLGLWRFHNFETYLRVVLTRFIDFYLGEMIQFAFQMV